MSERSGFDPEGARRARDEAVRRVDHNAEEEWKEAAYEAVVEASRIAPDGFTADDVWALIPSDVELPHEPRALGAVMTRARRDGLVLPTERFRLTARVSRHRAPLRVWIAGERAEVEW